MKIKITKCSGDYWYKDRIGQEFEVNKCNNDSVLGSLSVVTTEDSSPGLMAIRHGDYQIIEDNSGVSRDIKEFYPEKVNIVRGNHSFTAKTEVLIIVRNRKKEPEFVNDIYSTVVKVDVGFESIPMDVSAKSYVMGQLHFFAMLTIRNTNITPELIAPGKNGDKQEFNKIDKINF